MPYKSSLAFGWTRMNVCIKQMVNSSWNCRQTENFIVHTPHRWFHKKFLSKLFNSKCCLTIPCAHGLINFCFVFFTIFILLIQYHCVCQMTKFFGRWINMCTTVFVVEANTVLCCGCWLIMMSQIRLHVKPHAFIYISYMYICQCFCQIIRNLIWIAHEYTRAHVFLHRAKCEHIHMIHKLHVYHISYVYREVNNYRLFSLSLFSFLCVVCTMYVCIYLGIYGCECVREH